MDRIQPDLAGKVISADLRNLIKRVGDGTTLNAAERELFERYRASEAPPHELLEARAAALLRKFANGGRLTREERAEIGDWLPDPAPLAQRQTSDRYKHQLTYYTTIYQRDVRNIKRWIKRGREREPADFPPLDEPHLVPDWMRRCFVHRVPPEIEALEKKSPETTTTESPPPATAGTTEPPKEGAPPALPPLPPMNLNLAPGVSADLGLQQAQALVSATFEQMQLAIKRERHTEAAQLRREWQQLVQILRSWEKDIIKIQEGRGEVLRTREINTEMVRIFTTISQSFLNALTALITSLSPTMPADQRRTLAQAKRDEIFRHLKGTRFEKTWTCST